MRRRMGPHWLRRIGAIGLILGGGACGLATWRVQAQTLSLPDLTVSESRLRRSVSLRTRTFGSTSCAVQEGCVGGTGTRRLLRFTVATPNIGNADLYLGRPQNNPALFTYDACHDHYHFNGYARYELLDPVGMVVVTGRKQAFCLMDTSRYYWNAGPGKYTCSNQGITVGWQDVYDRSLDCQWLDVTGVPPGTYILRVTINPDQVLQESNYDNNTASTPVRL